MGGRPVTFCDFGLLEGLDDLMYEELLEEEEDDQGVPDCWMGGEGEEGGESWPESTIKGLFWSVLIFLGTTLSVLGRGAGSPVTCPTRVVVVLLSGALGW